MTHSANESQSRVRFHWAHGSALDTRLLDCLPDAAILTDVQGRILYWNASATRLFGWTAAEMVGQLYGQRYPEPLREWMSQEIAKRASGSDWDGEFEDYRKDGSRIWIQACVSRILDDAGQPIAVLGISHDITQRKRTEEKLLESQRRLDEAQRIAHLASWSWDPVTQKVWWSEGIYELFGLTPGAVEPSFEAFLELLHPDDRDLARQRAALVHAGTETIAHDMRLIRPDGTQIWIHSRSRARRDERGVIISVEGTDQDITERKAAEQSLKDSEERYRVLVEHSFDGLMIHGSDGVILDVNSQACKQLGYERSELIGKQPTFFDPFVTSEQLEVIANNRSLGKPITFETLHRHRDGHLLPVEVRIRPFPMFGKNISLSINRDLTESKQAQGNLRESEERFRNVLDNAPLAVFIKDLEGRYLFVNRPCADSVGMSVEQWLGKTASDIFGETLGQRFMTRDRQVIESGIPLQLEDYIELPNGKSCVTLTSEFPLFKTDGTMYAICGIVNDITDRQKMREERDRLWNYSPDLLVIATESGHIKQVNPSWKRILGWDDGQLIGQLLQSLVHRDDLCRLTDSLIQLVQSPLAGFNHESSSLTVRLRCRDGTYHWISWHAIYVPAASVLYGFARDVTQQKSLEEKYQQAQKMEAIGQLAGGVAHDFNNLLTVIRSYSDLLLMRYPVLDDMTEQLMAIREASERAAGLTAQLLAFSRKAIIEPKVIDLNKSVEASARLLSRLIGENIQLVTTLQPELLKVTIDPVQLEQTLMNLAVNARDAMPRGGVLSISTRNVHLPDARWPESEGYPAGAYVQLEITDDGYGMNEEVKRHLFEPFYTTKGAGKGTGLGLATVYGIVHQAGGLICVESQLGHGSTFRIFLPAVMAGIDSSPVVFHSPNLRGHETILLVEDEEAVRQLARLILEIHGYRVLVAGSGAEAIEAAQSYSGNIDMLLSDVVMPDLPGRELADCLRQLRSNLRVLYMSGYTDDAIVRHGVAAATDLFLPKPFTPTSLTQKVREVLDSVTPSA